MVFAKRESKLRDANGNNCVSAKSNGDLEMAGKLRFLHNPSSITASFHAISMMRLTDHFLIISYII